MRNGNGLVTCPSVVGLISILVLVAIVTLLPAAARSASFVTAEITGGYWDTIMVDMPTRMEITIANDVPVTGISLGFTAYSPDDATFYLISCLEPQQFPDCHYAFIVPGTRAALVPWLVSCPADPLPGRFYVGLTTTGDPMETGGAEHMLSFCFFSGGPQDQGDVRTLCFDSMFYPPGGEFVFVDAQQNSFVPIFNGPGCLPVAMTSGCSAMITNDNPSEVTVNYGETAQVLLSSWSSVGDPVKYRIDTVIGGAGTAAVDSYTGLVTYAPAPEDVGRTVTIQVEPACLGMPYRGTAIWTLLVNVINQPLTADFGRESYCAAIDHGFRKRDVEASDAGGAALEFFLISGPGEVDPATGYYFWIPGPDDYGLHTVGMGVTDGYDTLTGSFTVDVRDVSCCPGDVNADCNLDISDAVYYIAYVFKGGPTPPVMNWADPNADCGTGIGDICHIINYIFKYGPPPEVGCVE